MKCWHCQSELIWGGDHTFEDYCLDGDGVVTNLSCSGCDAEVLVYLGEKNANRKAKQRKMERRKKNLEIRKYKRMKKKLRRENGSSK